MRLDHPIFRNVTLDLDEIDTPKNYASWPEGKNLAAKMPVWRVQRGKMAAEVDYGIVSDPYGFEDSPDAEFISSGVNSKGPASVALGRHASLFLWGFAGDPTQMTESGRKVFVNAIEWMKAFDGALPIVRKTGQSRAREWALVTAGYRIKDKNGGIPEWQIKQFDETLWKEAGDLDRLQAMFSEKLPMVRLDGGKWTIDQDLVTVGIGSRDPKLLDELGKRLASDENDALARRLLARYAPDAAKLSAKELTAWVAKNRERLFFSDVAGYRWLVGPARG